MSDEPLVYTLEDLVNRGCGSITGDGYILPCRPTNHGLLRDRLPKDHPYYTWSERRWAAFLVWYHAQQAGVVDWREGAKIDEEMRMEKLIHRARFNLEGGVRIMIMGLDWEVEGTAAGIEGQRVRLEKLLSFSPEGMRISPRLETIPEARRIEGQYDFHRQLREK
jgi:hypothetical protein